MGKGLTKKIYHLVGKAIGDWKMIESHDRILVGVSGGKDSQTLLHVLSQLQKRAPVNFEMFPVHIDPGFDNPFCQDLERFINETYSPLRIEHTCFGPMAHEESQSHNPCYLCSRLRRKRLFELAKELDCRKIALGHNKDDIIETLFINMFYAGKLAAMKPVQSFFSGTVDIIRPLAYVEKEYISKFFLAQQLPEFKNNCPSAHLTKRGEIREMLETIYKQNKNIKGNIFRALHNVVPEYLLDRAK